MAAAIRAALARQGSGIAKVTGYEGDYRWTQTRHVDCGAPRGRAELNMTLPGRAGQPARLKAQVITDGHDLYSRLRNVPPDDRKKPWYRGKISELGTNEFRDAKGTDYHPLYSLYIPNCDHASLIGQFTKDLGELNRPGAHKCVVKVKAAISSAKGYAKDFYKYLRSIGGKDLRLTVWLSKGLVPTKYQLKAGNSQVEEVRYVVSFTKWHMKPIEAPPKSAIRHRN